MVGRVSSRNASRVVTSLVLFAYAISRKASVVLQMRSACRGGISSPGASKGSLRWASSSRLTFGKVTSGEVCLWRHSKRVSRSQMREGMSHKRKLATASGRAPMGNGQPTSFVSPTTWASGVCIGLAAGFFGGLVGQGGGVIAVPAMTTLASLTQHQAHGTSLIMVATTGLAGALSYWNNPPTRSNTSDSEPKAENVDAEGIKKEEEDIQHETLPGIDFGAALLMCLGASLFARLGAQSTTQLSGRALKKILGTFMLASSTMVTIKAISAHYGFSFPFTKSSTPSDPQPSTTIPEAAEPQPATSPNETAETQPVTPTTEPPKLSHAASAFVNRWHVYLATGCVTGLASGMLGIGGGLVMVPILTTFTDMHQSQILGSSLLAMVPPAIIGSWTHYKLGHVVLPLVAPLLVGTTVGAYLGGKLSTGLNETQQRAIIAFVVFTIGVNTLRR